MLKVAMGTHGGNEDIGTMTSQNLCDFVISLYVVVLRFSLEVPFFLYKGG